MSLIDGPSVDMAMRPLSDVQALANCSALLLDAGIDPLDSARASLPPSQRLSLGSDPMATRSGMSVGPTVAAFTFDAASTTRSCFSTPCSTRKALPMKRPYPDDACAMK